MLKLNNSQKKKKKCGVYSLTHVKKKSFTEKNYPQNDAKICKNLMRYIYFNFFLIDWPVRGHWWGGSNTVGCSSVRGPMRQS